ncbi:MAG TPA: hypothetical protein PKM08_09450, partial [Syntrophorhabdaceae bacterium]|nr:hypothetical protein [Syntrophorhabdaceae bacterium]
MKSTNSKPWEVLLSCPYCGEIIVTARDHSMLPEEMSDEEREAITCTEAGSDDTGGYCPHLALFSDWAYAGHSILGWEPEMGLLAARI